MHYKTIVLELIQSRPALHEHLRRERQLPAALARYAMQLETLHTAWKEDLHRTRSDSHPAQLRAEALELALAELVFPEESHDSLETDCTPHA